MCLHVFAPISSTTPQLTLFVHLAMHAVVAAAVAAVAAAAVAAAAVAAVAAAAGEFARLCRDLHIGGHLLGTMRREEVATLGISAEEEKTATARALL